MRESKLLLLEHGKSLTANGARPLTWGGRRIGHPYSGSNVVAPYLTVEPVPWYPLGAAGVVLFRSIVAVLEVESRVTVTLTPIVDGVAGTAVVSTSAGAETMKVQAPINTRGSHITCTLDVRPTNTGDVFAQVTVVDINATYKPMRKDPP